MIPARSVVSWAAGYLAFALAAHTYVLHHAMPCDNSLYVRYARDWAAGARLYADRYEPKTPVVFWLFRVLDVTDPRFSVYGAAAALLAAAATSTRIALTPLAPTAAAIVPVALIAWVSATAVHHLYDSFASPLAVLVFTGVGGSVVTGSRVVGPMLAGVALAVTIGLYPPTVLYAVALIPFVVWDATANGVRATATRMIVFLAAAAAIGVVVAGHAVVCGYWAGFLDAMAATRRYAAIDTVSAAEHIARWGPQLYRIGVTGGPVLVGAALCGTGLLATRWRTLSPGVRAWGAASVLWLVTAQVGTFPGGRHFQNYYSLLVGPLAVLAGLTFVTVPETPSVRYLRGRLLMACALAVVLLHTLTHGRQGMQYWRNDLAGRRTHIRAAIGYFREVIPKDEPVLVAVWDEWAELYWQAPRPSPSRHIVPWNLPETRPEFFAEWAADVLAHPPRRIVTDGKMLGPGLTDDVIRIQNAGFGLQAMLNTPAYTELRALVDREYRVVNGVGGLLILERVTLATPRS